MTVIDYYLTIAPQLTTAAKMPLQTQGNPEKSFEDTLRQLRFRWDQVRTLILAPRSWMIVSSLPGFSEPQFLHPTDDEEGGDEGR